MPKLLGPRVCTGFGLLTPMALAPMALTSGGALASACAPAGALGLVGAGYGDLVPRHQRKWKKRQSPSSIAPADTHPERAAPRLLQGSARDGPSMMGGRALLVSPATTPSYMTTTSPPIPS